MIRQCLKTGQSMWLDARNYGLGIGGMALLADTSIHRLPGLDVEHIHRSEEFQGQG